MPRPILLPLLLAGVTTGAAAAAINDGDREFARPHQMLDIGGRRLNLYCGGSGPVTVVFDAPSGDGGWTWHGVQPKVAARTRASVYDRAARDAFIGQCADAARNGFVFGSELFATCTGGTGVDYARALAAARLATACQPAYWDNVVAGIKSNDAGDAELRAARRSFGDLPLVVLVRGVSPFAVPGKPQSALNKAVEMENLAIQKEMAALSTRSTLHVVAGAGHIIQADKPQAVVDAVNEALDRAGY